MKSINHQAAVQCSKKITIHAGKEKVWKYLTGIDQWPDWQTEISRCKLNGKLEANSKFVWKTGGSQIHSTLHTVEPFKQFGWTGKTMGLFAIHNWTLSESNGETIVRVEESMEGILTKLFKKAFNKKLEKGMQTWLELLKAVCEHD